MHHSERAWTPRQFYKSKLAISQPGRQLTRKVTFNFYYFASKNAYLRERDYEAINETSSKFFLILFSEMVHEESNTLVVNEWWWRGQHRWWRWYKKQSSLQSRNPRLGLQGGKRTAVLAQFKSAWLPRTLRVLIQLGMQSFLVFFPVAMGILPHHHTLSLNIPICLVAANAAWRLAWTSERCSCNECL